MRTPVPRNQWMAVSFVAILIFAFLVVRYFHKGIPPSDLPAHPLVIEVTGEVKIPGVYFLEGPVVTVKHSIECAGGLKRDSSIFLPDSVLTKVLVNMQRVSVEVSQGGGVEVQIGSMNAQQRLALGGKLDINQASEDDLLLVPHMQSQFAAAIVERRKRKPWKNLDELQELSGVGIKTVERWRQYLDVEQRGG